MTVTCKSFYLSKVYVHNLFTFDNTEYYACTLRSDFMFHFNMAWSFSRSQGFKYSFHRSFLKTHFKARRSWSKVYLVERLISLRRWKNEDFEISWNRRISLYGPAHGNLQLIWVSNLAGPYTATLLLPCKGYSVCQPRFWKASYLSLSRMQSKLITPLSWERGSWYC